MISSEICRIARYDCPAWLEAGTDGRFCVIDLAYAVQCQVGMLLRVVRAHMFKDDGTMRYTIDQDAEGIRVGVCSRPAQSASRGSALQPPTNWRILQGDGDLGANPGANWDDAARVLLSDRGTRREASSLDLLWWDTSNGAGLYVGDMVVAADISLLQSCGIVNVVNCTRNIYRSEYLDETSFAGIKYLRFDISQCRTVHSASEAVTFIQPMLKCVRSALRKGESVMLHCRVGAHRAGTAAVICLMSLANLTVEQAIIAAKPRRPIIDPKHEFLPLLDFVETGFGLKPL